MTLCVFCHQVCNPAPTDRGWTEVGNQQGLHFDCAMKVVINNVGINQVCKAMVEQEQIDMILDNQIVNIIKDNINFSAQAGGYVVHGAIQKLKTLIHTHSIGFGTWYSGMEIKKVTNAYIRYWRETKGEEITVQP